jgi:hypothetical protein
MNNSNENASNKTDNSDIKLNDTWVIWIHKITDKNWLKESYKPIYSFNTIQDFWKFYNAIEDYNTNMYFLMREGVFPLWEDAKNRDGGCWSYIIEKDEIREHWTNISAKMIGESITSTHLMDINGISLSPRTNVGVIKIWNKNSELEEQIKLNIEEQYLNAIRYKLHAKNTTS